MDLNPSWTLYQSQDYWILCKPAGVHGDELLPQGISGEWKSAHRIDRDTSGCLLFCRPSQWERVHALFQQRQVQKIYLAGASRLLIPDLCDGNPIPGFIASRYRSSKKVTYLADDHLLRSFRSHQPVSQSVREASDLSPELAKFFSGEVYEVNLHSGARHQIRAFFAAHGAPLVGDDLYGSASDHGLELHAWKIELTDPVSGEKVLGQADFRIEVK